MRDDDWPTYSKQLISNLERVWTNVFVERPWQSGLVAFQPLLRLQSFLIKGLQLIKRSLWFSSSVKPSRLAMRNDGIWSSNGSTALTSCTKAKGDDWVGVLYVVLYAQRASPSPSCQSLSDFATTFLSKFQSVLLNASAKTFAGALYIQDLCWANLNFSHKLVMRLLKNGLPLSVIMYLGMPHR